MSFEERLLTLDRHWRVLDGGWEFTLVLETPAHWVRFGAFWGEAPGSHMAGKHATAWPTRAGNLHGWNARAGWWPRPCMTLLLHTRPSRNGTA